MKKALSYSALYETDLKACRHQLEIAKYSAIWTIPIAKNPFNLRLHQPEVVIRGIFDRDNHPKICWASLQNIRLFGKISHYLSGAFSPARRLALCTNAELISRARVSSFEVKSRADGDTICNFGIISQIRNSRLFCNLELMKTGLMWTPQKRAPPELLP